MYTIKQAAARSGLSVPTVRVWERRYGVVHPERTATRYRLYDDEAIERLIAMRQLVEHDGMRPSQAAERILSPETDIADLVRQAAASTAAAATPPGIGRSPRADEQVEAFVDAAARLDVPTMERILDEAFAAERFESAVEHVVFPALRAVGDRWEQGSLDVAAEHAASETVRRRVARFYDAVASSGATDVIVGLPPGAHHEIGALAFAVAARRRGLDVLYLGADVPLQSWRTAAETSSRPDRGRRRRHRLGCGECRRRHRSPGRSFAGHDGGRGRQAGPRSRRRDRVDAAAGFDRRGGGSGPGVAPAVDYPPDVTTRGSTSATAAPIDR